MYGSRLYRALGVTGQERMIAGYAYIRRAIREGPLYRRLLAHVNETQWFSHHELAEYQQRKLGEMLRWAVRHVPYYRRVCGTPTGDDPLAVLDALPYLDKESVRALGADLTSGWRTIPVSGGTGGSTGAPLIVKHNLRSIIREQAFLARQLEWAGYQEGERRAWWRGGLIVPAAQTEPPFWRENRTENMLVLSSYHLSEATVEHYRSALERFDPSVIQAYPSSISFLARYLEATGQCYRGKSLRGVITSSEMMPDEQRAAVSKVLGCPVFDWYGGYERVAAIGTCEKGTRHLLTDYSFTETLPSDQRLSELVGTSFLERAMPLIRYRTGDQVELAGEDARCSCGRAFPVVTQILGRCDDYLVTPDGRHIGRLDHVFHNVRGMAEAQIRQFKPDEIEIAVVPIDGFDDSMSRLIKANAAERLGPEMIVKIVTVPGIPRTGSGKVRGVVRTI